MTETVKKHIRGIGKAYPCKDCGVYPQWGAGWLFCSGCNFETTDNDPPGAALRDWNKMMKPDKEKK